MLEEIHDRAISYGNGNKRLFEKIGRSSDQYSGSGFGRELQKKLSTDTGESRDNEARVFGEDGNQGVPLFGEEGADSSPRKYYDIDRNGEIFDSWAAIFSPDISGEGRDLYDGGDRRGADSFDEIYGESRRSIGGGTQERCFANYQDDPAEIEELIAQLEAYVASLPKKPVIRKPTEDLSVEEMIERLLEQLKNQDQDNQVKHSRDLSEDAVELSQDEPDVLRADANSRGKVKLSRKITPLTESDLQAYLRAGGRQEHNWRERREVCFRVSRKIQKERQPEFQREQKLQHLSA